MIEKQPSSTSSQRRSEQPSLPDDRPIESRSARRFVRTAGAGALLLPFVWAGTAGLEFARAHLSHSLIARPERLFGGDGAAMWPILTLLVFAAAWGLAAVAVAVALRAEHRRVALAGAALLIGAAGCRVAIAVFPPDPAMYGDSAVRDYAALGLVALLPAGMLLAGIGVGRRGRVLAWLSGIAAIAVVWHAIWATSWSLQSGGIQPQLLAVEGMEGITAVWAAAAGIWLLGLPVSLAASVARLEAAVASTAGSSFGRRLVPGRKAALLLAAIGVLGAVSSSAPVVRADGPTIMAQLRGRTSAQTFTVAGIDRTARVYRPTQPIGRPGLVIVLHGVFGSGFGMENDSRFDDQAERLGWIAAYPDGVLDGWDAFGSTSSWGSHPGADDVAFIGSLIDRLEASDNVDPARVYVTGISRGGMMTYRLGCALSGRVAAIAPVSGNMANSSGTADVPCTLARPVSVLAIHGTADRTIPIKGGVVDIPFSPMADVIAKWRGWDGCAGASTVALDGASTTTAWSCKSGSTVSQRIVSGGWHTWPHPSFAATPTSPDDFDASRIIADFFVAHPLAPAS
jgi:polyhydroxybutyrate depolymerase